MNSIQHYGTTNYQMSFLAKGNKAAYEFIDHAHDKAKEFTRPIAEKKENMLRQYVSKFVSIFKREPSTNEINDEFCKKLIKIAQDEVMDTEFAKTKLINYSLSTGKFLEGMRTLKVIKELQDKNTRAYLNYIEYDDPEQYEACMEALAKMSHFEMAKEFIKNMFKSL